MSKSKIIKELTNLLAIALRHRIGSKVNSKEVYAAKYARDADILLREAKKVAINEHWSKNDKIKIKALLNKKLKDELAIRDFIDNKKFDIMESEVEDVLNGLNLL